MDRKGREMVEDERKLTERESKALTRRDQRFRKALREYDKNNLPPRKSRAPDPSEPQLKVARACMQHGDRFSKAMRDNGFAESYALRGERWTRKHCISFDKAFYIAAMEMRPTAEERKAVAISRLFVNAVNGIDDGRASAVDLGRMKDVDMFVHPGEVQVGVFAHLLVEPPDPDLLPESKPEPGPTIPKISE